MSQNKHITIQYYAQLREKSGVFEEELTTTDSNVYSLYQNLDKKYHFASNSSVIKVAINNEICDWSSSIKNGDTVVFIPPVGGG